MKISQNEHMPMFIIPNFILSHNNLNTHIVCSSIELKQSHPTFAFIKFKNVLQSHKISLRRKVSLITDF